MAVSTEAMSTHAPTTCNPPPFSSQLSSIPLLVGLCTAFPSSSSCLLQLTLPRMASPASEYFAQYRTAVLQLVPTAAITFQSAASTIVDAGFGDLENCRTPAEQKVQTAVFVLAFSIGIIAAIVPLPAQEYKHTCPKKALSIVLSMFALATWLLTLDAEPIACWHDFVGSGGPNGTASTNPTNDNVVLDTRSDSLKAFRYIQGFVLLAVNITLPIVHTVLLSA